MISTGRDRSGIHINCFLNYDDIDGAIAFYTRNLTEMDTCHGSAVCLNEISAVEAVLAHLKEFGEDHMEHLVMFRCDGTILAQGTKFIASVKAYDLVLQNR